METEPKMEIVINADKDPKNIALGVDRLKSLIERIERLQEESRLANYVLNNLLDKMPNEILEKLLKAIDAKMEVNKERTRKGLWKKQPDGSYHH